MENIAKILPSIGALDERITIQTFSTSRNAYADEVETWSDEATVWARVEYPATGSTEMDSAQQETSFLRVNFTIRYRGTVTAKKRIVYNSTVCDVLFTRVLGRKRYEVVNCEIRT